MSIKLSKKHGVNPTLLICPICKKDVGIGLLGRLKGDAEAPRQMYGELCDDCKKEYTVIIEVDSETNKKPTGKFCFVRKENLLEPYNEYEKLVMGKEEFNKLETAIYNNNTQDTKV